MDCQLCHFHVHSEYSALDGYIRLEQLVRRVGELKLPAVTLTDHGTLSGTLAFFNEAEKWNKEHPHQPVKPIIGMEAYIVADRKVRVKGEPNKHILLIAKNEVGYRNLLKLHYEGYATGAVYVYDRIVPRIDHTLLTPERCKGIIATTGCLGSEFGHLLREDRWDEAIALGEEYKRLFDIFVGEVQPSYLIGEDQAVHNDKIKKLASRLQIPVICTTDSHYLEASEQEAHQLVLAIQSKKDIYDDDRFTFQSTPLLSTDEMAAHVDSKVILNTQKLAEKCEYPGFLRFDKHGYRLPKFPIPELEAFEEWRKQHPEYQEISLAYLMYQVEANWDRRLKHTKGKNDLSEEYRKRLETEVNIIKDMGFVDYFLIVSDFTNWSRENGIPIGCGRGSAGGCLLSYILGITKLDPLKYGLLFSRFLNKDRVSLPDIDIDIDRDRRDEVKAYLARKYGSDRVASIATFSTMKVRACVKDIVRSLRLGGDKAASFEIAEQINKTLEDQNDDISYDEAMQIPAFKALMDAHPKVRDYAQKFEGLIRQTGIHAAGIIIGPEPLANIMPLMVDKNGVVATAYDGVTLEKDGFLKMDLLGLKNLTIIKECIQNIERVRGEKFEGYHVVGVDSIIDEPDETWQVRFDEAPRGKQLASKAYKLLREGKTNGVFQVEGQGMRDLLRGVYVNNIEEISAVLALNRPGPLASGMTAEYGKRKRTGEDRDEWYLHSSLRSVLKSTYGVLVYQEQVMQIAVQCAGFSEPEADTLRKAIGKKILSLMSKYEERFIAGCMTKSGMSKVTATEVWQNVVAFASYGFNKSHSVGYAHTTFQTAYLKANYPAEFFGALLSNEASQEKMSGYIREAVNMGLKILPVDVNQSSMRYDVVDTQTIRRNLSTMSGVGAKAVEEILLKRPFVNMVDFLSRVDTKKVNSRVIEALIKGGAFDHAFRGEKTTRKNYFDFYDDCRTKIKRFVKRIREKEEKYLPPEYCDKKIRKEKNLPGIEGIDRLTYLLLTHRELTPIDKIMTSFPGYDWDNPINIRKRTSKGEITEETDPVERQSKDTRTAWSNSEIVQFEEAIYGMPVTYNRFDFHRSAEQGFLDKYSESIYTFEEKLDKYENGDRVFMMVYIRGQFSSKAYAKDATKFTRKFKVEDRTGEGMLTLFDGTYKNDPFAWKMGNMLVLECRVNLYKERRSLVVDKVIKNCGTIDGRR